MTNSFRMRPFNVNILIAATSIFFEETAVILKVAASWDIVAVQCLISQKLYR